MISEVDIRDWGDTPTKPIESKEQYEHYLKCFDWFYDWSDDHSVWTRRNNGMTYLKKAREVFDADHKLWVSYYKS